MDRILTAQMSCMQRIVNFFANSTTKAGAAALTINHYKARLTLLDDYWSKFSDRHDDLTEFAAQLKDDPYFKDDLFDVTEREYISAKARLSDNLAELVKKERPPAAAPSVSVQQGAALGIPLATLPAIALPTFTGKQGEWESFKQRFSSLIKNKASVSPVEKLQHLLNAVQGPAAQRLKGLDVTEANFEVAWDKLVRRYDNVRIRLFNALDKLILLPAVKAQNVQDLNTILDSSEEAVRTLRDLQCPVDHYDNWLFHCIIRKLDLRSREAWETSQVNVTGLSTYAALLNFLERRIQTLEQARTSSDNGDTQNKRTESTGTRNSNRVSAHNAQATESSSKYEPACDLCNGKHWLHRCRQFNSKTPSQRLEFCKTNRLCLNCLRKGHFLEKCPSSKRCFTCQQMHHTKLHLDQNTQYKKSSARDSQDSEKSVQNHSSTGACGESSDIVAANSVSVGASVLLATARVVIASQSGKSATIRALIDPGAERCFITQRTVQYLNLDTKKTSLSVIGVGASESSKCTSLAFGILKSKEDNDFAMGFSALVLNELTRCLPKEKISKREWPHISGLNLADPQYADPAKVDCILGADVYSAIISNGLIKGPVGTPVAQKSVFGWLLTGSINSYNAQDDNSAIRAYHVRTELSLSHALSQFWELEEVPRKSLLTPDEERCEKHFIDTYKRDKNGRFVVRLPFAKRPNFAESREIAAACLAQSERRLQRKPKLAELYDAFMLEYVELQHMELVPAQQINRPNFYLPHHAVVRPENPDKIRVVFNASQKCRNGLSLNDLLLPGPKLQSDISLVLTHWRFFNFAFTTDVVKMFRQILIHREDADWQRILWRSNKNSPPQDFRCITVTYGTASAPYLALRVMRQLAIDGADEYPAAAAILNHTLYVDDLFGGADSINEAIRRREQLVALLASAGMTLGKWAANRQELLQDLSPTTCAEVDVNLDEVTSTLGLKWLPKDDVFIFKISAFSSNIIISKRTILSEIARLFDPLGWLAPVVVKAKIIMQDLWLDNIDWDDKIPINLRDRWTLFREELADIPAIRIPRWLGMHESDDWQLHGFADASQRAYAAVIYAVVPGRASVLLMAKTKVAPTKVQSLPRLELCAGTLLARLISHLLDSTQRPPAAIHTWSDSKVVLEWLKSHPSKWQTFIANRTSEILTRLPTATWRHVRSADNAADCATRGLSPADLAAFDLWWHGPAWLTKSETDWPLSTTPADASTIKEVQSCMAREETALTTVLSTSCKCMPELQKISRWGKILRILIYCSRWTFRKSQEPKQRASLSQEWALARIFCFRAIQMQHYKDELAKLSAGEPLSKRSPLVRLSPFICEKGLIRVGGRLHHSQLPYNEKHPVVLPGNCFFVKRLVEDAHELTLHGGVQLMLSHLYRSVWITRGPVIATGVFRRCVRCTRFGGKSSVQQMGSLPAERITPSRAFAVTGLDYAGPVPVLFSRGRGAKTTKGYVAIFICLVTRAVHIEIVSDLSTNAFLGAFARFCARRGVCEKLYSDNATTFKSAAKELQALFSKSSPFVNSITPALAFQGTEWSFIPPRAPHFGGLWEAAVRSFKHHFRRAIGEHTLTFEELSTLAAKIEACLNSRPLCPLSSQATDAAALTPSHFLVGSSLLSPPEPYNEANQPTLTNRWRLISNLRDSFWTRWRKEVLHYMQKRNKWVHAQPNLKEGDVVLLTDELSPPTQWRLGLVIKTHPGADGLVRVATVKTATTTFTRPVVKLIKLPTEPELVEFYNGHADNSTTSARQGEDISRT